MLKKIMSQCMQNYNIIELDFIDYNVILILIKDKYKYQIKENIKRNRFLKRKKFTSISINSPTISFCKKVTDKTFYIWINRY